MSLTKRIFLFIFFTLMLIISSVLSLAAALGLISGGAILSIQVVAFALLPVISWIAAKKAVGYVMRAFNNIDLENIAIYDEATPFALKLERYLKESKEKIRELQERIATIEAITENMREGIILVDNNGNILSANSSAHDIFKDKSEKESVTGKNILLICRNMDLVQNLKLCVSGASTEMLFEKDSKLYNVFLSPVYNVSRITGAVMLFLDSTEKYKAERYRREFSANVSHELKTPLTTISALSEMIGGGMVKDCDIKIFADKISGQTKRLIDIIEDIIRLSEFDEKQVGVEYSDFDLSELTKSVILNLQEKAREKEVSFNLNIQENLPVIRANKHMIDELLYNLCDNAIKYNKQGGSVSVNIEREQSYIKICVRDTGIGIPEKHHSRIFERFYRVDRSRSQKTGGTGLGLSIVKHIAEHHRGKVELESKEGEGTAITCYFDVSF